MIFTPGIRKSILISPYLAEAIEHAYNSYSVPHGRFEIPNYSYDIVRDRSLFYLPWEPNYDVQILFTHNPRYLIPVDSYNVIINLNLYEQRPFFIDIMSNREIMSFQFSDDFEGYYICDSCKGNGVLAFEITEAAKIMIYYEVCVQCKGTGLISWIDNI